MSYLCSGKGHRVITPDRQGNGIIIWNNEKRIIRR